MSFFQCDEYTNEEKGLRKISLGHGRSDLAVEVDAAENSFIVDGGGGGGRAAQGVADCDDVGEVDVDLGIRAERGGLLELVDEEGDVLSANLDVVKQLALRRPEG